MYFICLPDLVDIIKDVKLANYIFTILVTKKEIRNFSFCVCD